MLFHVHYGQKLSTYVYFGSYDIILNYVLYLFIMYKYQKLRVHRSYSYCVNRINEIRAILSPKDKTRVLSSLNII